MSAAHTAAGRLDIVPPVDVHEDISPQLGEVLPPWIRVVRTTTTRRLRTSQGGEAVIVRKKYALKFGRRQERAIDRGTLVPLLRTLMRELSPTERAHLLRDLSGAP
jgi:hypothetical protein